MGLMPAAPFSLWFRFAGTSGVRPDPAQPGESELALRPNDGGTRVKRGLLVDYGGVLTSSVLESFAAFCETEEIDVDTFRSVVLAAARTADSPFARVETGAMTQE